MLFFIIFFLFVSLFFLSSNVKVSAQVPSNTAISCDNVGDPEFNSLRPYQANTQCTSQTASEASFCGNNLTIKETITQTYPGSGGNCSKIGNKVNCTYSVFINHPITIDLSGAELPIMGNTEDVLNSQNSVDELTNANKVNAYVSWYLNGVNNRAEYGESNNTDYDTVNFSGPIQKLLPGVIVDAQRIGSIENAKKERHDQVAVCAKQGSGGFLGTAQDILGLGKSTPVNCYQGNGTNAQNDVYRLDSWKGDLSFWNAGSNKLIEAITALVPDVANIQDSIRSSIANHWNKRVPPLPWEDDPFATPTRRMTGLEYRKYYNEWKGKTCVIVPVIQYLACFENVLVPNKYADLFAYVPLSSTEDVEGEIKVDSVSSATNKVLGGVGVSNVRFSGQAAQIFIPHMLEANELGDLIQSTYTPKDGDKLGDPTNVAAGTSCNSVEVRSNDGDDLFATQITGNLSYTASFTCSFDAESTKAPFATPVCNGIGGARCVDKNWTCGTSFGSVDCGTEYQCGSNCSPPEATNECKKDVYINLSTKMSAPLADDVWSRLVAGPMSVFKRIFPKTNTEGSVGQILDIPGSTNISYSGLGVSSADTDLKIPHIGGVSEYFLKGIQTALRPKGMGEPLSFGANQSSDDEVSGEINCDQSVPEININGLNKEAADNVTKMWYAEGPGRPYFKECNNDVIKRAQARGVDPLFALAIWIHESDASNYEAKTPVEDFGIHGKTDVPPNNFSKQLDFFLNLPDSYAAACGKRDMETFISMFWFGECTPVNLDQADKITIYMNDLEFIYSVIAPGIALPNYPN